MASSKAAAAQQHVSGSNLYNQIVQDRLLMIIDARERSSFLEGHIDGAINIPKTGGGRRRVPTPETDDRAMSTSPRGRLGRKGRRRSSSERLAESVAESLEVAERCMSHGRPRRQFAGRMGQFVVIYAGAAEWQTSGGVETCSSDWAVRLRQVTQI